MCIFCKIINNEIPCYKIYETKDILCFLDISQATAGHVLVVPKKHIDTIFDLDEDLSQQLFVTTTKVAKLLKKTLMVNNVNILSNNGELAGQTIKHFHIHVIPRYSSDDVTISFHPTNPTEDKLKSLQKALLENIK